MSRVVTRIAGWSRMSRRCICARTFRPQVGQMIIIVLINIGSKKLLRLTTKQYFTEHWLPSSKPSLPVPTWRSVCYDSFCPCPRPNLIVRTERNVALPHRRTRASQWKKDTCLHFRADLGYFPSLSPIWALKVFESTRIYTSRNSSFGQWGRILQIWKRKRFWNSYRDLHC